MTKIPYPLLNTPTLQARRQGLIDLHSYGIYWVGTGRILSYCLEGFDNWDDKTKEYTYIRISGCATGFIYMRDDSIAADKYILVNSPRHFYLYAKCHKLISTL